MSFPQDPELTTQPEVVNHFSFNLFFKKTIMWRWKIICFVWEAWVASVVLPICSLYELVALKSPLTFLMNSAQCGFSLSCCSVAHSVPLFTVTLRQTTQSKVICCISAHSVTQVRNNICSAICSCYIIFWKKYFISLAHFLVDIVYVLKTPP